MLVGALSRTWTWIPFASNCPFNQGYHIEFALPAQAGLIITFIVLLLHEIASFEITERSPASGGPKGASDNSGADSHVLIVMD